MSQKGNIPARTTPKKPIKYQRIVIGRKTFKFIASFGQFNLTNIKTYMGKFHDYDSLMIDIEAKEIQLKRITDEIERMDKETQLDELYLKRTGVVIDLLCCLCTKDTLRDYLENSDGVNWPLIEQTMIACEERLGHFDEFWNTCPGVDSFTFPVPDKLIHETFVVHAMDRTTVLRDTLAEYRAKQALQYKSNLDAGRWDDICQFVAILVRPKKQKEEIAFSKSAFVDSKKIKDLSTSDKLAYYKGELDKSAEEKAKLFETLKLEVAIGVIKSFVQKKNL